MPSEFTISTLIPASPEEVYNAWLSSEGHSAMTGSPASISSTLGDEFTAWDSYIQGRNLELESPRRILQSWRTTEFAPEDPDSQIEVILEPDGSQTRLTLHHTHLPPHGGQYEQGWVDAYFEPMQDYFRTASGRAKD